MGSRGGQFQHVDNAAMMVSGVERTVVEVKINNSSRGLIENGVNADARLVMPLTY